MYILYTLRLPPSIGHLYHIYVQCRLVMWRHIFFILGNQFPNCNWNKLSDNLKPKPWLSSFADDICNSVVLQYSTHSTPFFWHGKKSGDHRCSCWINWQSYYFFAQKWSYLLKTVNYCFKNKFTSIKINLVRNLTHILLI